MEEQNNQKNTVNFYCRNGAVKHKKLFCLAGLILTLAMIELHIYKKVFRDAYIPKKTILFYGAALLVFLLLLILICFLNRFRLGENSFCFRGKKYDKEKYSYTFVDFTLAIYTVVNESIDAVIPEYNREIEAEVPESKAEKIREILKNNYTEIAAGATVNAPEANPIMAILTKVTDAACVVVICILAVISARRGYIVNEWEISKADDGLEITAYNGNKTDLVIPAHIDGLNVVGLKEFRVISIWDYTGLDSLVIPDTVKRISGNSFTDSYLKSLTMTTNVRSISKSAFRFCNLLETMEIYGTNEEKDTIDLDTTFSGLKNLILHDCNVADGMADGCRKLRTVIIDGDVNSIGARAFENCPALQSLVLSDSIETIGEYAFYGCRSIENIDLPEGLRTIGDHAFAYCLSLLNITIPDNVETIGDRAFFRSALTELTVPAKAISYKTKAFEECKSLQNLIITGNADTIGDFVFEKSRSLQTVQLPDGIKNIGTCAFSHCASLQSINIPGSVENIGDCAFYYCTSLQDIDLPDGLENIGNSAFYHCEALQDIRLPDSIKTIDEAAFLGSGIKNISLPDSLDTLGKLAFVGCIGLESLKLPSSLQSVPAECFMNCSSLKKLEIPEGYTAIEPKAFYGCVKLEYVTLPDSLEVIDDAAFQSCIIPSVFLPDNLTQIAENAFYDTQNINNAPIVLCYTNNCKAAYQIETNYEYLQNGQYKYDYTLLVVDNRNEYENPNSDESILE